MRASLPIRSVVRIGLRSQPLARRHGFCRTLQSLDTQSRMPGEDINATRHEVRASRARRDRRARGARPRRLHVRRPVAPGSRRSSPGGFSTDVEKRLTSAVTDAMTLADASAGFAGVWAPWAGSWTTAQGTTTRGRLEAGHGGHGLPHRAEHDADDVHRAPRTRRRRAGSVSTTPLTKWVPGLVGVDGVTMRELCQNTSGINDYIAALNSEVPDEPDAPVAAARARERRHRHAAVRQPRARSTAARRPTLYWSGWRSRTRRSRSWQQLYKEYIFDKLGMTRERRCPRPVS